MSNLMSGVLPVLFSGRAHSFISCQLLVKGFGLSQPRKRVVGIKQEINPKVFLFTLPHSLSESSENLTYIRVTLVQEVSIDIIVWG